MQDNTQEICSGCGKPIGTGHLLEQFPEPPAPRTSLHRLYLLAASDFSHFPTREEQSVEISQAAWTVFGDSHSCIVCADYLDNVGARYE